MAFLQSPTFNEEVFYGWSFWLQTVNIQPFAGKGGSLFQNSVLRTAGILTKDTTQWQTTTWYSLAIE